MDTISGAAAGARESARQDNGQFGTQHRAEGDVDLSVTPAGMPSHRSAVDAARLVQRDLSSKLDQEMRAHRDLLQMVDAVELTVEDVTRFPDDARYLIFRNEDPREIRYGAIAVTPDGTEHDLGVTQVIALEGQVTPRRIAANTDEMTGPYASVHLGRGDYVLDLDKYRELDLRAEADEHHAQVARWALSKTTVIAPAETAADVRAVVADQLRDEKFENEPMVVMTAADRSEAVQRVLADHQRFSRIFHEGGYEAYTDEIRSTMRDVFHERYDEDELWEQHENGELQ